MTPDELRDLGKVISKCRGDVDCQCNTIASLLAHIEEQDALLKTAEGDHAELWAERNGLQVKVAEQEREIERLKAHAPGTWTIPADMLDQSAEIERLKNTAEQAAELPTAISALDAARGGTDAER